MGMSRCSLRSDPVKWMINKKYQFNLRTWWDGQGQNTSGSGRAYLSLVGLSSITLDISATGYASGGFYYEFYDEDDNLLGERQTASGTFTFDVADAAYMTYYAGGSPTAGSWRTIVVSILIRDAIAY